MSHINLIVETSTGDTITEVAGPRDEDVEGAVGALDGKSVTLATLEVGDQAHLAIGGGPSQFIVYVTHDNERFFTATSPGQPAEPKVALVAGGQLGEFPGDEVVDRATALQASLHFAKFKERDPSIVWRAS